jgi:septum formation protein
VYHPPVHLILASSSPRRAELLTAAGFTFEVVPADIDESPGAAESPERYVQRLAGEKAAAVARRIPDGTVVAADTTVVVGGKILGKPADDADARQMLEALSGRVHDVLTGVTVQQGRRALQALERTHVRFAELSRQEIDWYVATGEPQGKAGGYAVQGLASRFVERVDGSYSNVVGLPVALVYQMLKTVAGNAYSSRE